MTTNWYSLCKSMLTVFKKPKINLSYDPGISLPRIYPNDSKSYPTDTCSDMFIDTSRTEDNLFLLKIIIFLYNIS